MLFTFSIASAVLASSVLAAPYPYGSNSNSTVGIAGTGTGISSFPSQTSSSAPSATSSLAPASPTPAGTATITLDLTQQLFLADTAVDRFALLPEDSQFIFNFGNPALKGKGGHGGDLIAANRKTFPALVGTGAGMAVGFLGPCGFNTPHVHPRSVELQMTEMLPENGVFNGNVAANGRRVITNTVEAFQMQPFYQGSVHTQFNPDCTNATFVASFTSEDCMYSPCTEMLPCFTALICWAVGTGQVADELFAMSPDVVSATFGQAIDGADVAKFKTSIPTSIAEGVEQCLMTCGIAKR
jgi:hypothetical protein